MKSIGCTNANDSYFFFTFQQFIERVIRSSTILFSQRIRLLFYNITHRYQLSHSGNLFGMAGSDTSTTYNSKFVHASKVINPKEKAPPKGGAFQNIGRCDYIPPLS